MRIHIQEAAWSRVLLEKLTSFQPIKFSTLHGTQRSITGHLRNTLKIYFIHLGHKHIYCILIHAA